MSFLSGSSFTPPAMPAAASSSAEIRSMLFCLATTMPGSSDGLAFDAPFSRDPITASRETILDWRLMRSVGRRGSHRLRIRRRFSEKALITFPFHDPAAGGAMTVADKLRLKQRRSPCT